MYISLPTYFCVSSAPKNFACIYFWHKFVGSYRNIGGAKQVESELGGLTNDIKLKNRTLLFCTYIFIGYRILDLCKHIYM